MTIFFLLIALVLQLTTAPTTAPTTSPSTELRSACDSLVADAVKKSYGWAWAAEMSNEAARPSKRREVVIAMDRGESASAGLALLWAGRQLGERSYIEASRNVARGVAISQHSGGMILSRPTFASSAGAREAQQYVPSRGATIAGLALLLAQLDEPNADPNVEPPLTSVERERFRSSAIRAATWLSKQQAHNGAWPVAYPPNTRATDATRVERLDDPVCVRDSTIALFVAGDVTAVRNFSERAKRGVDLLLNVRLARPAPSADLWATAYNMEGGLTDTKLNFLEGADLVASRHAIQTLLVAHLLTGEANYADAIARAAKSIGALPHEGDKWDRFPNPINASHTASRPATTQPTTRPVDIPINPANYGMTAILAAAVRTANVDRTVQFDEMQKRGTSMHHELLSTMAGLNDTVLLDGSAEEVRTDRSALQDRVWVAWKAMSR